MNTDMEINIKSKADSEHLSEAQIDEIVIAQADDDAVWEAPTYVRRAIEWSIPLPSALAARVAFFARLHREPSVEDWLRQIVQERLDLEEAAFIELKRDLVAKRNA